MSEQGKEPVARKHNGKLSLHPLQFEEAVKDLLEVKPSKNSKRVVKLTPKLKT